MHDLPEIGGIIRRASYPKQPIGFCIPLPAVQRDAVGELLPLIAGNLTGIKGIRQKCRVPELVPDGIILEAEGVGAIIRQTGAAVRIGGAPEEGLGIAARRFHNRRCRLGQSQPL